MSTNGAKLRVTVCMPIKIHPTIEKSRKEMLSNDHFRILAESSLTGAYLIQDGLFRYVNPAFCRIFGYDTEEIVDSLGPKDLTAPEEREWVARNTHEKTEGNVRGVTYSFHGLKKDGTRVFVEVQGSVVKYMRRPAIVGTMVNSTDRVRAEESFEEADEKYRRFFNEDIVAHFITTADGTIVDCNNTFAHLFGFSCSEEAKKSNAATLFPVPGDRDSYVEQVKERRRLEGLETEYVRKDGKRIFVYEKAVGKFDPTGNLKSIHGYLIDETNKRQLEAQFFEAQKMESIGTLVSGIAHDLNNVLSIILGQASIMVPEKVSAERITKSRESISKAVKRGAHTIRQLLTFAHKVEIIRESVRVNDLIEELVDFLRDAFPEKISFSVELDPKLPSIHADPNQLQQVFINLCVNARDAMPSGGTLSISTFLASKKSIECRFPEADASNYLMIRFTDTGAGIEKQNINKIFEPFFTTKKNGSGTGLGLSVVYGIMKAHHGFTEVQSEIGFGTEFTLYLPIPVQAIEAPVPSKINPAVQGHGELIMVVEDEEPVLDYMRATLEGNGYRVLPAKDGDEAVKIFSDHCGEIDLVTMDMGLPKKNGAQVLTELKAVMPQVRVILTSGYIEPEIKISMLRAGVREFLSKPFGGNDLLEKIQQVLKV
jgi:two-component system cell cycle sensor histidine kinase/response regulator CckA